MNIQANPPVVYRRRVYYVDRSIQRPLIAALVFVEVVLVALAIAVAYWRLNVVLDDNLYRVHITEIGPVWKRLAVEAIWILGVFAAINIVFLVLAERLGTRFERRVLFKLRELIYKIEQLDFSSDVTDHEGHKVLQLALAWREQERCRFAAVGKLTQEITSHAGAETFSKAQVRTAIQGIRSLIG